MKIVEKIYLLFVIALPMVGVFDIADDITLPLFIGTILFILKYKHAKFYVEDLLYISFILFMLISLFYNLNTSTYSSLKYILGYVLVFLAFSKTNSIYYKDYKEQFYRYLYYTTYILILYTIYEFLTRNFMPNLFIDLPRLHVVEYNPIFNGKYIRARGFAVESGHLALYFEFSVPLVMHYLDSHRKQKFIFLSILLVALFCVNSAINMVLFTVFFLVYYIKNVHYSKKINFKFILLGMMLVILFYVIYALYRVNLTTINSSIVNLYKKAFLISADMSVNDRLYRLNESIKILRDNLFLGVGPMNLGRYVSSPFSSKVDTSLNMLLDIWLYSGILGLVCFLLYILIVVYKTFYIKGEKKFYILASLVMVLIHYQIVTNFWYPWLWVLISIIQCESR
jgi:hypothetical protein